MNERGEMNLIFVLMVAGLTSVLLLSALKLQRSFSLLEKRSELFLCAKETEGELVTFMKFIGRTNWAIRNISKAQLVMIFVPGLQGAAMNAEELKKALKLVQNAALIPYLKKLSELKSRGCPVDPRHFITPFRISVAGFKRNVDGAAELRTDKWTYRYVSLPYVVSVEWDAKNFEGIRPQIRRSSWESAEKLSSISSSY